ncbi:MAG: tRNA (adenosine(37)-N6)-threonylcarbamoyltransferase complex transferase subunit TsaD [Clostridia bacterium]|nr:tRNA (adenosine(37)-N6)-threonylcarbamoyltransferase complex transferase subunit TsaD [Clostridia bacterium]
MKILAFESSCDDTCASVVEERNGKQNILSNIVSSQTDIHAEYGGVVPEIASRAHSAVISAITYKALSDAKTAISDIDVIGVTNRPGLIGSLLVGVNFAKSLAVSNGIPIVPVHHIKGHVAANYFSETPPKPPFIALVASGGHTSLLKVDSYTDFATIGSTRDDAIGECFDKIARVMGIPYPGGAEVDRLASFGDKYAFDFPSAAIRDDSLDFSFSGLKTHAINLIHKIEQNGQDLPVNDISASLTDSIVRSVEKKLETAFDRFRYGSLVFAGGVSANSHLRKSIADFCTAREISFFVPDKRLCGDNAAMIGAQAFYEYLNGTRGCNDMNAIPSEEL